MFAGYVISRVKKFSSPALYGWSGAFNFRGTIWKTEHGGENPDIDFVPLLFTLLT